MPTNGSDWLYIHHATSRQSAPTNSIPQTVVRHQNTRRCQRYLIAQKPTSPNSSAAEISATNAACCISAAVSTGLSIGPQHEATTNGTNGPNGRGDMCGISFLSGRKPFLLHTHNLADT